MGSGPLVEKDLFILEISSNTIKALGIFGRLSKDQEDFFDKLEAKYSKKPASINGYDVFRHLTLTFIHDAKVKDIQEQLDLLHDLKKYLPVRLKVKKVFVKDEVAVLGAEHIAVEFGLEQTKELVEFVRKRVGDHTVATPYTKVVWFVPKGNQEEVISILSSFKKLKFTDFYLVSNKQNDANTIYTTNRFFSKE